MYLQNAYQGFFYNMGKQIYAPSHFLGQTSGNWVLGVYWVRPYHYLLAGVIFYHRSSVYPYMNSDQHFGLVAGRRFLDDCLVSPHLRAPEPQSYNRT